MRLPAGALRSLGVLLLAAGVAVCVGAGAQLGQGEYALIAKQGSTQLSAAPAIAEQDALPTPARQRLVQWWETAGGQFVMGMLLLIGGAVLGRVAVGRDAAANSLTNGVDFSSGLARMLEDIDDIAERLRGGAHGEVQAQLEQLQTQLIAPMIDSRDVLQRQFGTTGYANVISPLSSAERLLNRAWSALVDGHAEESLASLELARDETTTAAAALHQLVGSE
ncbi:MAG: hypothetical protein ACR2PZ_18135 [Pseudomonadales bacterium]